jgi:DNA-binding winged helix-turn-helix (wHTH) protein
MATYRFDKFVFDTDSYQLRADDVLIALRPKTAVLMAVLIEQRQHLLGKQALFSQVWHSDHVQHQSLFQAISEIRKILAPLQPIKTHPNLGYQWVAPVSQLRERRWMGRMAGSVLPLAAVSAILIWYGQATTQVTNTPPILINTQSMLQSPAMQAFSNGIEHLNNQQLAEAWDYFELAELENPLFLEASIMKAEILFKQADYLAAKTLTSELLERAITQGEVYVEVSAQGLLSRISEQTGQWNIALDWALQADSNARNQGFACVAENTRIRIAGLMSETDQPVNEAWISKQSELTGSLAKGEEVLTNDYPDASHCESLHERSEADSIQPDLSQCLDIGSGYQSLAMNRQQVLSSRRWV